MFTAQLLAALRRDSPLPALFAAGCAFPSQADDVLNKSLAAVLVRLPAMDSAHSLSVRERVAAAERAQQARNALLSAGSLSAGYARDCGPGLDKELARAQQELARLQTSSFRDLIASCGAGIIQWLAGALFDAEAAVDDRSPALGSLRNLLLGVQALARCNEYVAPLIASGAAASVLRVAVAADSSRT